MKKLVVCLALLLAGCSTGGVALQSATPTVHTPQEVAYLSTLRNQYNQYSTVDDSLLITTGRNICLTLDQGVPIEQMLSRSIDPPLTREIWAYNVGVAVGIFCPAHQKDIDDLRKRLGG